MFRGTPASVEYKVVNPATGQVENEFPTATDAEIASAIDRAIAAVPARSMTPLAQRVAALHKVFDLYEARIAETRCRPRPVAPR